MTDHRQLDLSGSLANVYKVCCLHSKSPANKLKQTVQYQHLQHCQLCVDVKTPNEELYWKQTILREGESIIG